MTFSCPCGFKTEDENEFLDHKEAQSIECDIDPTRKVQITVTITEQHKKYLQKLADDLYEGNISMALRNSLNAYQKLIVESNFP